MPIWFKRLARAIAILLGALILLVGAALLGANTGPGRRLIEALVPPLSGGVVRIDGLTGRFPDAIQISRLTVADTGGVWLTVSDAVLDWSPRRLIESEVSVARLEASDVSVARLPEASAEGGDITLPPLRAVLSRLRVARLNIGPAVAGRPVTLAVAGAGELLAPDSGEAHLAITALAPRDGAPLDHYSLEASMAASRLHATVNVSESAHGLIADLARLPDLGAIAIAASIDGPLNALATRATIEAGSLRGDIAGRVDMVARGAELRVTALAPAMTPGPGIGWSSIRLEGNVHGPLAAPEATATLAIDGLTIAGGNIGSLRADVAGDTTGATELHARIDGIRVPGPSPDVLAGGSVTLDASLRLADAGMPFRFSVRHALFSGEGTGDAERGEMHLTLPDLAPLAAVAGVDLQGHANLEIAATRSKHGAASVIPGSRSNETEGHDAPGTRSTDKTGPDGSGATSGQAINLSVTGGVAITDGVQPIPALVGDTGTIDLAASVRGADVKLTRLALGGAGFNAAASGQLVDHVLSVDWSLALNDLNAIRPGLAGTIAAHGQVGGSLAAFSVAGDVTGDLATNGERLERLTAHFSSDGLPDALTGRVTAGGTLLDAPLDVAIGAERRPSGFHLVIDRANWKSLTAGGTLDMAEGQTLPSGNLTLRITRLADLTPFLGRPMAGELRASLDSSGELTRISATVTGGAMETAGTVAKTSLDATIADPSGHPIIAGTVMVDRFSAGGVNLSGRLDAKGPLDGLAVTVAANTGDLRGLPARVASSATLNATAKSLSLTSLTGNWGRETARLLAPARIAYAQGVAVDRLRLGFRQGELTIGGRWAAGPGASGTALTIDLVNVPADMLEVIAPDYAADGTVTGEARLTGSPARPEGSVRIRASGLRLRAGAGRALPPATSTLDATLEGSDARVSAKLTAGGSDLTLVGLVPLDFTRPMDLRLGGSVDLALLNPLLAAQGRDVRGRVDVNLAVAGTPAKPGASGMVRLTGGDVQDSSVGTHIASIAAQARIDGDTIRLEQFAGKAGQGTLSATGTVAIAATPVVDLSLHASNARILSTDLASAVIDADLTLRGALNGTPALNGTVRARTAEIRVPEKLPASIAVLPVIEAGAPPARPAPPAATPDVALNLTLDAPSEIYVRGRGLDAELGGRVVFAGTAASPVPQGALHLRRGTFTIAGQSLNLTSGTIDFAGGPLTNPSLKLVSTSGSATLAATLTITGDVRNPKIVLSSVPDMPQDEILSQLLFNTVRAKLSPFQVAQIAVALAAISGVGPSIGDPLAGVRSALGLDQLSVGSDPNGGTTLQAGRYLARGVRVGVSQSASGTGTQATVQIDITKGLKLETTAGTGSASATPGAAGSTNGSGVGLTYQFEY